MVAEGARLFAPELAQQKQEPDVARDAVEGIAWSRRGREGAP